MKKWKSDTFNYLKLNPYQSRTVHRHRYYEIDLLDYMLVFVEEADYNLFHRIFHWMNTAFKKSGVTYWTTPACRYIMVFVGDNVAFKIETNGITYLNVAQTYLGADFLKYGEAYSECREGKTMKPQCKTDLRKHFGRGVCDHIRMAVKYWYDRREDLQKLCKKSKKQKK